MDINDFINKFENHPILFVGTGLSLRYCTNSYSWDSLLMKISFELTDNEEHYLSVKSKFQNDDGSYDYRKIATEIESSFNSELSKEENRNGKFKEVNDVFFENMKNELNISRFKIYLSNLLEANIYKDEMKDEISELKKARKNISSIITTNYDTLIEDIFKFNPLIGNDILLSNPYGSVYKIHGCISQPDKLIITEKDYNKFNAKYELIRAQLLSLFMHNPIVFLGYGIGDDNIKNLLKTIFSYVKVNTEEAKKIQENFLLIEYEKGSSNIETQEHDIEVEDSLIRVNKIKTDDFKIIFKAIADLRLPVSTIDIRKVQEVVKDIYTGGKIKVQITENIDDLNNDEKVLAIGHVNNIKYDYKNISEIIAEYFTIIEEENKQLLYLIDKQRIQEQQFFPIFAFSKINNELESSERLRNIQRRKIEKILNDYSSLAVHNSIEEILEDSNISKSNKSYSIIKSILEGQVNLNTIEEYLINYEDKKCTEYRRMLCAYDFKKYSSTD